MTSSVGLLDDLGSPWTGLAVVASPQIVPVEDTLTTTNEQILENCEVLAFRPGVRVLRP